MNTRTTRSFVGGLEFPFPFSDNNWYVRKARLRLLQRWVFWLKVWGGYVLADIRFLRTNLKKECYYGSFKGEFGHFLAHTLPFLMYLHSRSVRIHYCGMELHRPFLVDENGRSIVASFHALRDFFAEVPPDSNATKVPHDVAVEIKRFEAEVRKKPAPFWNISNDFYYWFIHRDWLRKRGYTRSYALDRSYGGGKEDACVIFPRKKGAAKSKNNGEEWDYGRLIELVSPFFKTVYVCGHPAQVNTESLSDNRVRYAVSSDNAAMLGIVSRCRLLITQHSGVVYLGDYTATDILLIYKGGKSHADIGSLNNTLRFRQQFESRSKLSFAFDEEQVVDRIKELKQI